MGIAKMKKLTLLAEQSEKEAVLAAMQEMQDIEVISLADVLGEDEALIQSLQFEDKSESVGDLTQTIQDIRYALSFLNDYIPQVPFLKRMKEKRPVLSLKELEVQVQSMDYQTLLHRVDYMDETIHRLQEQLEELKKEEDFLRRWQNLTFLPADTKFLKHFSILVGSVESEKAQDFEVAMNELDTAYAEDIYQSRDTWGFLAVMPEDETVEGNELLQQYGFQVLNYPYDQIPSDALKGNLENQKQLIEQISQEKASLKSYGSTRDALQLAEEYFTNKREREKAKELIANNSYAFVISGWTEASKIDYFTQHIVGQCNERNICYFQFEVEEAEIDAVPTKLENHELVKPFETMTAQFGLPKYDGFDPTPWYYPFHIAFFGMMSADLGYGLLLWLGTAYALKEFELSRGMRSSLKMFNQLSYGTMFFGLIFGSFFGFNLPFRLLDLTNDVIIVMAISVFIGIVHMLLGYGIKFYLMMKDKDYISAYLDAAQWALMLLGVVVIAVNLAFVKVDWLTTAGIVLIVGNILGMFLVKIFSNNNKLIGVGQALFGIMDIASLIGDLVSYTRLTALAVSGANIGMAFNLILGLLPPIARFTIGIILFVALHALNIFITYLGAYVHSMRLEYVEFFGKFYDTDGKAFTPLKTLEKYIWIKSDK
ncbi:V-type ATP synthase subunit I [Fundicoccus culcitae]|uniref:V-type ATP synthase subunit I n=1 Tax=Fundicoccus culcitae TaxID=2969821 RepID=A0ABY5P4G8_9LACT|nr:V-type ATP synthase subunit I [Fundicoccus culcitae]UUX33641.1 V-type ATP synthase subunit I [Fundicoccus culcitae]